MEEKALNQFLSHIIHSEADGLQVQAFLPQLPSVLLHQSDHHAAHVVFVVCVLQLQLELWVGPECVCGFSEHIFSGQFELQRQDV